MATYLQWLEAFEMSGFGHLSRHSSFLYPLANLGHVLGAALLVGAIAVFDSAVILRRRDEAASIGRLAIPIAAGGLALQVPTGAMLLAAEARALGVNPAFLFKMAMLALGLVNVAAFHTLFGGALRRGTLPPAATIPAVLSLVCWIAVLLAGRMIAYL